jgi:hypothetical protein
VTPEEWIAIPGYEGIYAVSNLGNVMSMNYAKSKLPGLMTPHPHRGYLKVYLRKPGKKAVCATVHALVMNAFVGPRPSGMQINHIDGCKSKNALSNLEYCTPSANQKHSFRVGLQCNQGEHHSQAKLDKAKVIDIRKALANGARPVDLAKEHGVTASCISYVKSGRRWPHIAFGEKAG